MSQNLQGRGMPFRAPRDEEEGAHPLLDPLDNEPQPLLSFTFSVIQLVRIPVIILSIADSAIMPHCRYWSRGSNAIFEIFMVGLVVWSILQFFLASASKDRIELKFGNFVCFCGRRDKIKLALPEKKHIPYVTILGDSVFAILIMIQSILAGKEKIWEWEWRNRVFGLTLTICILQYIVVGLGILGIFFHIIRKLKVVISAAEFDEKTQYSIPEGYTDVPPSEPRESTSSYI